MEQDLWQYLKSTSKPIVLYGMGNGADKIINVLNDYGIEFKGVFATDGFVREKLFHGHKLATYDELKNKYGEMIVLLCFGSSRPEVIANIKRISSEQELYAPEVPVYGTGLFTNEYLNANLSDFKAVFSSLADDISKQTFEDIINFKLSGKPEYLFNCEVDANEPYNSFLKLSNNEHYLDLGAYNGDTVADFVSRVKDYRKITAIEPDIKTFKKLLNNTSNLENIECINACVSDKSDLESFGMRGGRNSSIAENGIQIKSVSVDDIMKTETPTFIKADVEGEELKMINGMKETIKRNSPKMLISCYHRTEDLISIPKAVFEINKNYKLYIRHFSYIPAWDTNFYFI